jgi:hypothetical protein
MRQSVVVTFVAAKLISSPPSAEFTATSKLRTMNPHLSEEYANTVVESQK